MQQTDDTQNIAHEHLVRYVFRQLSPEEESRIEDFLDANPHEADVVDGILQFCKERGIRTRESFEEVWGVQKGKILETIKQKTKPSSGSSPAITYSLNQWAWATAASFALLIVLGAWAWVEHKKMQEIVEEIKRRNTQQDVEIADLKREILIQSANLADARAQWEAENQKNDTPFHLVPAERNAWLTRFIKAETGRLNSAGEGDISTDWRQEFITRKDDKKVIRLLRDKFDKDPESLQSAEFYVLGAFYLLRERKPAEAVRFLEKAKRVDRPDYDELMLAAYLENQQYGKANQWIVERSIPPIRWPKGSERFLKKNQEK